MNQRLVTTHHAIGTPMEGGHYIGMIMLPAGPHGLIKAPRAPGGFTAVAWGPYRDTVAGALSFVDGRANTLAMAEAGSMLAQLILALEIDGHTDWYLPALDELEVAYRACKPGTEKNAQWARSGINLHAIPPAHPYTADAPAQTAIEIFRAGGAEAFETDDYYWTSTQLAAASACAWSQYFGYGDQDRWHKDYKIRACAVRRFTI